MPIAARRFAILAGATALLCFSLWVATSPSERFHAVLVPLWLLIFGLQNRPIERRTWILGAGMGIGLLGLFALVGGIQAQLLGARLEWHEPLQKLLFTMGLFVLYNGLCALLNSLIARIPAARKKLKTPQGWWLRWLRMSVALCLFAPYLYASFNLHRFKYANASNPQRQCNLAFEEVKFAARDGVALRGWFIPRAQSQATIIGVHGIGSNRGDMLSLVPFLHRAGFNVFLFDLRAHGDSAGHTTTFGRDEAHDVEASARWVARRTQNQPAGLYAFSMGGSAALYALGNAARNEDLPGVRAVVLDSTFSEFEPLVQEQLNFLPASVARPLLSVLSFATRLEIGAELRDIAPGRFIGQIAPRPLLLIHGTSDSLIPIQQARLNFARAHLPKSLYLVEGAGHCGNHRVAGDDYEARVAAFFRRALK